MMPKQEEKKIPKVLLCASKAAEESQTTCMHTKGPWDKGHWANRK